MGEVVLGSMLAAVYARRSTEEHQADSIEVQVEAARRYISAKGWTLSEEHIYVDDAISRAEFVKRPGLIRMLNGAEKHDFQVVVTRDETRLGGDTNRTSLLIQSILDAGCRLAYYYTDEDVRLDGALAKIMVSHRNFASELEREKISQRTHEHLEMKAQRGLNVGGACYGYDNVEVFEGERRVRVEYRINAGQAEIVREIFERYSKGDGLRTIAKDLNNRRVPSPRGGTGSWAASTIQPMLRRERYLGQLIWGKAEKGYKGGTKVRTPRAPAEWTVVEAPHLRIISDDLAEAVKKRFGKKLGVNRKSSSGAPPKYLLSAVSVCGECGGRIKTANNKTSHENRPSYACGYHRERGSAVCSNGLRRPVDLLDAAVINKIASEILTEEVVASVLKEVRARLAAHTGKGLTEIPALEKQAKALTKERDRLVEAISQTTAPIPALVAALSGKETLLQDLGNRIRLLKTAPSALDLEVRRVEREARARLKDLRATLLRQEGHAPALQRLLKGPLVFTPVQTPDGKRYRIEGQVDAGVLLMASPAGFEPA